MYFKEGGEVCNDIFTTCLKGERSERKAELNSGELLLSLVIYLTQKFDILNTFATNITENNIEYGLLTHHVQIENIALAFSFGVVGLTGVISRAMSAHSLQH